MSKKADSRTTIERDAVELLEPSWAKGPRATIVVYAHDDTRVIELREGDSVVVGRAPPAEVVVDDMTISRRHARFTFHEGKLTVEDLGSRNGSVVRGMRVDSARLRSGDDVRLGAVALSIHLSEGTDPPLGIRSYDQFAGKLDDELLRAQTFGHSLAVIAVFAPRDASSGTRQVGQLDPTNERHVSRWATQVRDVLRPVDTVAVHGPHNVLILLPQTDAAGAERLARTLSAMNGAPGRPLYCGVAVFPDTAKKAGALVREAHTAARTATLKQPVQLARGVSPLSEGAPITHSPVMQRVFALGDRVAASNVPVLILGETGTGKEVIARHLHARSPRAQREMFVVNCAALPNTLIESALFGHEKGAFTGADNLKKGVFEEGNGSTVFLDEVGELSQAAQAALLRVLETKRFYRVGSTREIEVDVRILAATHRDLEGMVESGTFRADLYYRLNTMTLKVPALRARPEEIMPLAEAFLSQTVERWHTSARAFAPATTQILMAYRWPGNVRELRNVIERAAVICTGEVLEPGDLPERLRASVLSADGGSHGATTRSPDSVPLPSLRPAPGEELSAVPFRDRIRDYEVKLITDALDVAAGNQSRAAELLQMPLRTLVHKIKAYGLKKTWKREDE